MKPLGGPPGHPQMRSRLLQQLMDLGFKVRYIPEHICPGVSSFHIFICFSMVWYRCRFLVCHSGCPSLKFTSTPEFKSSQMTESTAPMVLKFHIRLQGFRMVKFIQDGRQY